MAEVAAERCCQRHRMKNTRKTGGQPNHGNRQRYEDSATLDHVKCSVPAQDPRGGVKAW
jgi:hypothetical protein